MFPKVKKAIHLPYFKIKDHLESTYALDHNEYWNYLIESHMFRGNDSSKAFFYQFAEEVIPENVLEKVSPFLSLEIQDILKLDDEGEITKATLKIPLLTWIEAHKQIYQKKSEIQGLLNEDEKYYYGYLLAGTFEAIIVRQYRLKDVTGTFDKYFYYISW